MGFDSTIQLQRMLHITEDVYCKMDIERLYRALEWPPGRKTLCSHLNSLLPYNHSTAHPHTITVHLSIPSATCVLLPILPFPALLLAVFATCSSIASLVKASSQSTFKGNYGCTTHLVTPRLYVAGAHAVQYLPFWGSILS